MLKRLTSSSLNLLVLGASAAIFILAFGLLQGIAAASTPETATILVAARDLQIGIPLQPGDLVPKSVYVDETTALYVSAEEAAELSGAFTALPVPAGQPVLRANLIGPLAAGERFSAILTQFPGHSLFPLPLDATNVIAPPVEAFLPGDLVGITVVIRSRPPQQATPTPDSFTYTLPGTVPTAFPTILPQPTDEAAERGFPPLAKDLFPGGLRVAAVQGLPQPVNPDDPSPGFDPPPQARMLILLVTDENREKLSLALQQGDSVFISLLEHAGTTGPTEGFTYWDLEAWFQEDRGE